MDEDLICGFSVHGEQTGRQTSCGSRHPGTEVGHLAIFHDELSGGENAVLPSTEVLQLHPHRYRGEGVTHLAILHCFYDVPSSVSMKG